MNILTVIPTFLCPFACPFCFNKLKLSQNESLDVEVLDKFLKENHNKFDRVVLSGGEPMNYSQIYFNLLIDKLKEYYNDITVKCYPYSLTNYRSDVKYEFSYDFLNRARANDAWGSMLLLKEPFKINLVLTPQMIKIYHPNVIFKKFSLIPNLQSVEIHEYYKNEATIWNIDERLSNQYMRYWLSSKISTNFINVNKERMRSLIGKPSKIDFTEDYNYDLLPNGQFAVEIINDEEKFEYKAIEIEDMDSNKIILPSHMYNDELLNWFKSID